MGGYDLVHYDDLAYVASAHQERECNNYLLDLNRGHSQGDGHA